MATLLQINSGIFSDNSQSSKLANNVASEWLAKNSDGRVIKHDFAAPPVPHLDAATMGAFMTPEDQRSPEQAALAKISDEYIAEVMDADIIVLGVPLYNLSVPSTLKAWFDQICRAGVTFRYTPEGQLEGMVPDKKVVIAAARGGLYEGTEFDTQTHWLRHIFGLIGISQVEFIYVEGVAISEETAAEAIEKAHSHVESMEF